MRESLILLFLMASFFCFIFFFWGDFPVIFLHSFTVGMKSNDATAAAVISRGTRLSKSSFTSTTGFIRRIRMFSKTAVFFFLVSGLWSQMVYSAPTPQQNLGTVFKLERLYNTIFFLFENVERQFYFLKNVHRSTGWPCANRMKNVVIENISRSLELSILLQGMTTTTTKLLSSLKVIYR